MKENVENGIYGLDARRTDVLIHARNVESAAFDQIKTIRTHPSMKGLIAIMPDVHGGAGCVIGFTGKFNNSVIPNIVGVDIGCGVITYRLPKNIALDLPAIYDFIEHAIPSGFNSRTIMVGMPKSMRNTIDRCEKLVKDKGLKANPSLQAGTLGGGNHFIEIERSPRTGDTYLTIHSGSRKFGLEIAKYHQAKARKLMKDTGIIVPRDLEYLPHNLGGKEYLSDMMLAQDYASLNRMIMLNAILTHMGLRYDVTSAIESIHNFISPRDKIVRKGAISAHENEKVVIPLSMGKDGGIVLGGGLGNKSYNYSAPHGAGRLFGRREMKRKLKSGELTMPNFEASMCGVYTKAVVEGTIDESPAAYKSEDVIMDYLEETVNVEDIARPIMAYKAI